MPPLPTDTPPIFRDHFWIYCRRGTRLAIGLFSCFLIIFLILGIWPMAAATLGVIAIALWALDLIPFARPWQFAAMVFFTALAYETLALRGVGGAASFHIYLLSLLTMDPITKRNKLLAKILMSLGIIGLFVIGDHWGRSISPLWPIAPGSIPIVRAINLFAFCLFIAAMSYHDARTREHLSRSLLAMAATDSLTGLPNRRGMEEFAAIIQNSHARHGRAFTIVMGDIDHFKAINDHHGHKAGDLALKAIAECLLGGIRGEDQVARWGGEEFLLLLPETSLEDGVEAAERIRARIAQLNVNYEGSTIPITMTFGVAEAGPNGSFTQALGRADEALYRGKAAGRNRVERG